MAAWIGAALIDGGELARRQADLIAGPRADRAAAIRLSFGRSALVMAGEVGYEKVRVEELIGRAGSNRARFYDAFPDKEACFTWAYEAAAEAFVQHLLATCAAAEDWASGMRCALVRLAHFLDSEPGVARGLLSEPGGAGAVAVAKHEEVFGRLSRAIDRGRRETITSHHPVPEFTPRFILSAIQAAALKFLADPDPGGFEDALPDLLYVAVDFYLGAEKAQAQLRALGAYS